MKTLNITMAALFLIILSASSCATLSPAVVEHEEEITQQKHDEKDNKTENQENSIWREHLRDRGYSD